MNPAENPIESSPTPTIIPSNSDDNSAATAQLVAAIKSLDEGTIQPDDEAKLRSAIDLASKIPQSSPDYTKAQTLSADATRLSDAIKLANQAKLTEAIKLAKEISLQSQISKKVSLYIIEWSKV